MHYKYRFTIFTPAYNRKETLHRAYESLCQQTFKDFEWLIIDDGSTDNTSDLVKEWIKENKFQIEYIYQENHHKFFTLLKAARLAKGELFIGLDSDDKCTPDSLEKLSTYWKNIPDENRLGYSGLTTLCIDQHGKLVGKKFPSDIFDSDTAESLLKYHVTGEKWGFIRTDIMQMFSYPDNYFANGYIPEGVIWMSIAKMGYKTRYINDALRIYYVDENDSAISFNPGQRKNSFGAMVYQQFMLNNFLKYFRNNPRYFISSIVNYTVNSFFQGKTIKQSFTGLDNSWIRSLFILLLPVSYYKKWRIGRG